MPDPFKELYRLSRLGEFDKALAVVLDESGLRLASPFDEDPNHAWYVVGDLYFKKGNFGAAAQAFHKAIADRPDDHQALMALANCYAELGTPILSEKFLRIAMKYSDDADLLYNLGNALFDQGRYKEAMASYGAITPEAGEVFDLAQKNLRAAEAKSISEPD